MSRWIKSTLGKIALVLLATLLLGMWVTALGDPCFWHDFNERRWPLPHAISHCYGNELPEEILAYALLVLFTVALGYLAGRSAANRPRITAAFIVLCAFTIVIVAYSLASSFDREGPVFDSTWKWLGGMLIGWSLFALPAAGLGVFGAWLAIRRRSPVTSA